MELLIKLLSGSLFGILAAFTYPLIERLIRYFLQ